MFDDPQPIDFEPLRDLALFSWENAPHLCSDDECCAYHRVWSLLRFLLSDGAAPVGRELVAHGLKPLLVAPEPPRILISGGADTGVTAMVASVFRGTAHNPKLTFVDRCATPAEQHKRLAAAAGLQIETETTDILNFDGGPFDAIVAHSFLGFIPEPDRPALFKHWAHLLKPAGRLVFSNNVAPDEGAQRHPKSPERAKKLATLAQKAAASAGLNIDPDLLRQAVVEAVVSNVARSILTEAACRKMLDDANFDLKFLAFYPKAVPSSPLLKNKSQAERVTRVGFCATKRS